MPTFKELLSSVDQRFCVRHWYNNFKKQHPGNHLKDLMWSVAKATYPQEWERIMKDIQKVNDDAYKDLLKIPPKVLEQIKV